MVQLMHDLLGKVIESQMSTFARESSNSPKEKGRFAVEELASDPQEEQRSVHKAFSFGSRLLTLFRRKAVKGMLVESVSSGPSFDDVAGMHEAKRIIFEALVIPLRFPHIFQG
jgi:hypothetical protein